MEEHLAIHIPKKMFMLPSAISIAVIPSDQQSPFPKSSVTSICSGDLLYSVLTFYKKITIHNGQPSSLPNVRPDRTTLFNNGVTKHVVSPKSMQINSL
jgi:hypothetical protein